MVELGLSPKYVLDEMALYEMQPLIEKAYLKNRESWEQTRTVCGYIHKAWFKGEMKMNFPWDKSEAKEGVTLEQAQRLELMMKEEEKNFAKQGEEQ